MAIYHITYDRTTVESRDVLIPGTEIVHIDPDGGGDDDGGGTMKALKGAFIWGSFEYSRDQLLAVLDTVEWEPAA